MKTFYLDKSSRCHVNEYENELEEHWLDLISYGKRVASCNKTDKYVSIYGWNSATTQKHVNLFLEFLGLEKMTKQQMIDTPYIDIS